MVQIHSIQSKQEFLAFLDGLRADLQSNPNSWENPDLLSFLEAFGAWIDDSEGAYRNAGLQPPEQMSWGFLADALSAAAIYE